MTDLTVLHAPKPLHPLTHGLFAKSTSRFTHYQSPPPIDTTHASADEPVPDQTESTKSKRHQRPQYDSSFLSPPVNTWKSPSRQRRHRPTRSQSAPPGPDRRSKLEPAVEALGEQSPIASQPFRSPNSRPLQPKRSYTSFASIGTSRGGELLPPPPPLLRPTTFWRKTRRSGVTGASYSPSSHLIRRSTYIAAGLRFDAPIHDLSALCVESRVGCIVIPPEFSFSPN